MATTDTHTGCPCCPRAGYAFRVPLRLDDDLRLSRHYRCGTHGGYRYVHKIAMRPPAAMGGVGVSDDE